MLKKLHNRNDYPHSGVVDAERCPQGAGRAQGTEHEAQGLILRICVRKNPCVLCPYNKLDKNVKTCYLFPS
jgi:hypothetical protein